jgi:hypothetical protein
MGLLDSVRREWPPRLSVLRGRWPRPATLGAWSPPRPAQARNQVYGTRLYPRYLATETPAAPVAPGGMAGPGGQDSGAGRSAASNAHSERYPGGEIRGQVEPSSM